MVICTSLRYSVQFLLPISIFSAVCVEKIACSSGGPILNARRYATLRQVYFSVPLPLFDFPAARLMVS